MAQCIACEGPDAGGDGMCPRCSHFWQEHERLIQEQERQEQEAWDWQQLEDQRRLREYADFKDDMYWNGAWVV